MAAKTAPSSKTADRSPDGDTGPDWSFARRPFWIFSHFFALSVVSLFLVLGLWQLSRLGERQDLNALIEARTAEVTELTAAPDGGPDGADLDYRLVAATVTYVDPDFVQIANRSQGGVAGRHVVAIAELADGSAIAVNRGFVPSNAEVALEPVPSGETTVSGWLRATVPQGRFGATDTGEGDVLPRLDTQRIADRLDRPLPAVWLQLAPAETEGLATFPDPVALPPLDEGPHRSYAVQWFIFAALGVLFYGALVWRRASGAKSVFATPVAPDFDED
ncbi:MAG: SURF1 family protein [Actinomycetota bacterium]